MCENALVTITLIFPCCNEEKNIPLLYRELTGIIGTDPAYELIFVDDGSTDGTLRLLQELAGSDKRIRYLSFSRNFGHQKALKAGLDAAGGQAVISLDADLQHPVALIPELITRWREGYEVVYTIREEAPGCSPFKRLTSRCFYRLMNLVSDIRLDPGAADFRLLDRKVVEVIRSCPEENLFLRGIVSWCGFRQTALRYRAHPRYAGVSQYNFRKMVRFAFSGITSFSIRPLRISIYLASLFAGFALFDTCYALYIYFFTGQAVSGWTSLVILMSFMNACILLMLGILGEYLGKMFMEGKGRPAYIVKETNIKEKKLQPADEQVFKGHCPVGQKVGTMQFNVNKSYTYEVETT